MKAKDAGFTLVEIMIVVAIIGMLAAIAIPSFLRARHNSQQNACINNLRQIEAAKEMYAADLGLTDGALIPWSNLVGQGSYLKKWTRCPLSPVRTYNLAGATSSYHLAVLGSNPLCLVATSTHVLESN